MSQPITMTQEREDTLRSETKYPSHAECPDNWADCNWAREAATDFAHEIDALRAALSQAESAVRRLAEALKVAAIKCGICDGKGSMGWPSHECDRCDGTGYAYHGNVIVAALSAPEVAAIMAREGDAR